VTSHENTHRYNLIDLTPPFGIEAPKRDRSNYSFQGSAFSQPVGKPEGAPWKAGVGGDWISRPSTRSGIACPVIHCSSGVMFSSEPGGDTSNFRALMILFSRTLDFFSL
jgi:hypothetical protein